MAKFKNAHPKPGETEYTGRMGRSTSGIPEDRPHSALSASDQARLARITDEADRERKFNERIWFGETPERTAAQVEGDERS
jgi:hypothetical protein